MSKLRYVRGMYSDECGGQAIVAFRESSKPCEPGKHAYEVKVIQGGKTVYAPSSPLCTRTTSAQRIAEDVIGFFEHASCGRGELAGRRRKRQLAGDRGRLDRATLAADARRRARKR